ncbi:MAG: hypothetical protein ACJA11_003397 [Glaciecola sp.]|jgi:hypothetical protein
MTPVKAVEYLSRDEYDWKLSRKQLSCPQRYF